MINAAHHIIGGLVIRSALAENNFAPVLFRNRFNERARIDLPKLQAGLDHRHTDLMINRLNKRQHHRL